MLFRSTIPDENFEKERKIVLEELARDRSIRRTTSRQRFAPSPTRGPHRAARSGHRSVARRDHPAQVLAYYKKRYVPANMTLVVMGDFDDAEMLAIVKRTFGAAPRRRPEGGRRKLARAAKDNVEIAAAEKEPARLLAAFPLEGSPWDATTAAAMILLAAAGDGQDAPLMRALTSRGVKAIDSAAGHRSAPAPWSTVVLDAKLERERRPQADSRCARRADPATGAAGDARGAHRPRARESPGRRPRSRAIRFTTSR
jgi:zinc protease